MPRAPSILNTFWAAAYRGGYGAASIPLFRPPMRILQYELVLVLPPRPLRVNFPAVHTNQPICGNFTTCAVSETLPPPSPACAAR
jgi:hypothetical protein